MVVVAVMMVVVVVGGRWYVVGGTEGDGNRCAHRSDDPFPLKQSVCHSNTVSHTVLLPPEAGRKQWPSRSALAVVLGPRHYRTTAAPRSVCASTANKSS